VFNVASDEPQIGFMTYKKKAEKDGYFVLLAEPQKSPKKSEIRNKEIVFVLDTSGSMGGRPIETVKKAMRKAIENLGPNDYFNIYNFNTSVYSLFPTAQKASAETQKSGLAFVDKLVAGGGTIMLEPFKEALKDNGDHADRMRIILGMTDGDVGNDDEILNLVSSGLGNNRLFMLGVDAAANRYLIEKMAASGNGKATFVLREDDVEKKVDEFYANFAAPVLTDIQVSWGGLNVTDILPSKFADLYAGQPLIVAGKYSADNLDTTRDIIIKAKRGNEDYTQTIKVNFPSESLENSSIAAYWARQKIDNVLRESAFVPNLALEEMITALGLNYGIMTQYTSFIAIDETVRNASGSSQTVEVPVYEVEGKDYSLINGTSYEMGTRGGQSYQKSSSNMPLLSLQSSNSYTDSVGLNETKRSPGSLTNQNNINPTPSKARIDKVVEGVS
jgi:Ca-activated chloride channel family protein